MKLSLVREPRWRFWTKGRLHGRGRLLTRLVAGACLGWAGASSAQVGPVAAGPSSVAPGKPYEVRLAAGADLSGQWRINWGDGAEDALEAGVERARHVYAKRGVHEVRVAFADEQGADVPVGRDLAALTKAGDPLAYWNFNDGPGGGVETRGEVGFVPSVRPGAGRAAALGGRGYLRVADRAEADADFFAVEFWLRPADLESRQVVCAGLGSGRGNARVYIEGGQLCLEVSGGDVARMPLTGVETGRWHHFGVSYERSRYFKASSVVRFYRDGGVRAERAVAAERCPPVVYAGMTLGAQEVDGRPVHFLKGDLDEVVFHRLGIFPGGFWRRYRAMMDDVCSWSVAVGASGAESFTVDEPAITREVRVELDPDPKADSLPVLQAAIARAEPGTRLKIVNLKTGREGGLFYLRSRDAHWRLLVIEGKTDLEIDGGGAGFVVRNSATKYVTMARCTRVALRNLRFDIDQTRDRPSVYARVEKIEPEAGKLHLQYVQGSPLRPDPVPAGLNHWRWRGVDGTTRALSRDGFLPIKTKARAVVPGDGSRWVFTLDHPPSHAVWKSLAKIGSNRDLLQINNAHFGGSGVSLYDGCRHLTFDRVNFYGVMGMVFLSSDFDYLRVSRCVVGLPPGMSADDRPFSAASDGFHFHGAEGGHVIFEYNDVAMTDDDPVSIKDGVYRNVAKRAERELWIGEKLAAGTRVELRTTNLDPLSPAFTATVVSQDTGTKTVFLDKDIPGGADRKFHMLNLSRRTNHWVLRGNRFHALNGRLMLYTGDGTLEGNRIEGIFVHMGFSAADFDNAGRANNIMLKDNLVVRAPGDTSVWGAWPTTPVFDDIALVGNSLVRSRWTFNAADGLVLSENYFEPGAAGSDGELVRIKKGSRGVELRGNSVLGRTPLARTDEGADAREAGTVVLP